MLLLLVGIDGVAKILLVFSGHCPVDIEGHLLMLCHLVRLKLCINWYLLLLELLILVGESLLRILWLGAWLRAQIRTRMLAVRCLIQLLVLWIVICSMLLLLWRRPSHLLGRLVVRHGVLLLSLLLLLLRMVGSLGRRLALAYALWSNLRLKAEIGIIGVRLTKRG